MFQFYRRIGYSQEQDPAHFGANQVFTPSLHEVVAVRACIFAGLLAPDGFSLIRLAAEHRIQSLKRYRSIISVLSWCFYVQFGAPDCVQVMAPYNPNDQRGYAPNQAAVSLLAFDAC